MNKIFVYSLFSRLSSNLECFIINFYEEKPWILNEAPTK